jgi:hypothetical protein
MEQAPDHRADLFEDLQGGCCLSAMHGTGYRHKLMNDPEVTISRSPQDAEPTAGCRRGWLPLVPVAESCC